MIVPSRIELDVNKEASSQIIEVHKGDTKSRYISFKLFSGMIPISLEAATTAIISGVKPDNTKVYNDCISSTDSIAVVLTNQMIAVKGDVNCELVVYGDNESKLTSSKFIIRVHDVLTDGTEIESTNEFGQLDLMMKQAGDLSQAAIKAQEAATSASLASTKATEAINARDEAVLAKNAATDRATVATAQAEYAESKANTASVKADEALASATTATTKASEAASSATTASQKAQQAVDTLAEIANARQSTVKNKTFANLDERFEENETDIINNNNLMKISLTEVDRELTQLQQTIQNANTNQEAKLTQSSYSAISLPKNASNSHMSASVKGMTLKNELNYNRDTWAEWSKSAGVNGDSTGLELPFSDTTTFKTSLNTNLKASTKYGLLLNIASNNLATKTLNNSADLTGSAQIWVTVGEIGNKKIVMTTQSTIGTNRIYLYQNAVGDLGLKVKLRDIRIFELPTGSQIETDFNTLTADELAIKYPYTKGDSAKNTLGAYRNRSVGKNLFDGTMEIGYLDMSNGLSVITDLHRRSKTFIRVQPNKSIKITKYDSNKVISSGRIDVYEYDENKKFIKSWTRSNQEFIVLSTNTHYIRFCAVSDLDITKLFIISEGSLTFPYEPYTESTQYVIAKDTSGIVELRSVPSARDEIVGNRLVKRNFPYTLQASDVTGIIVGTNVDRVKIKKPLDSIGYNNATLTFWSTLEGYQEKNVIFDNFDDLVNIGFYSSRLISGEFCLIVAKGTTLAQAQSALVGKKLTYQLATPIESIIETSGTLLSNPNGTVYRENVVADAGVYNGGISILNTTLPIATIEKISKIDFATGTETSLDVSQAVINANKLSLTHPSLAKNDIVFFTYFYATETTNGELSVTYYDSRHTIKDTTNGKTYQWKVSSTNGVPSITLVEV